MGAQAAHQEEAGGWVKKAQGTAPLAALVSHIRFSFAVFTACCEYIFMKGRVV
jgi:hypothetical protein